MNQYVSKQGQMPLAIGLRERPGFDLFLPGTNLALVNVIKRIAKGQDKNRVYLWGQPDSGKSHLLHAACILADSEGYRASYIPLAQYTEFSTDLLQELEQQHLVCLDDLDAIAGQPDWEQAVLHLYNRIRERQGSLIISSQHNHQSSPIQLQDLRSRLAWDLEFHIKPLADYEKIKVLQLRADAQAFLLPDDVAEYLVKHCNRNMGYLMHLLDQFAQASLVEQRKITIPFAKKILQTLE